MSTRLRRYFDISTLSCPDRLVNRCPRRPAEPSCSTCEIQQKRARSRLDILGRTSRKTLRSKPSRNSLGQPCAHGGGMSVFSLDKITRSSEWFALLLHRTFSGYRCRHRRRKTRPFLSLANIMPAAALRPNNAGKTAVVSRQKNASPGHENMVFRLPLILLLKL